MSSSPIPTDDFSRELREIKDRPDSIGAGSTVHRQDFYGNCETWIVETYRADGKEIAFLQRSGTEPMRLFLPSQITAALARQREQLVTRSRRRAAASAVETKKRQGTPIGNPEALRNARQARKRGKK